MATSDDPGASGCHDNQNVQQTINHLGRAQELVQCQICPGKVRKNVAERICYTCDVNLCENCVELHKLDNSVTHDFVTFRQKYFETKQLPCIVHQILECDMFCIECDVSVCYKCFQSGFHEGHMQHERRTSDLAENESSSSLCDCLGLLFLAAIYLYMTTYQQFQNLPWNFLGFLLLVGMCLPIYNYFKSSGFITRSLGVILLLSTCFYLYQTYKFSGKFQFERTYLESIRIGNSRLENYRGAVLKGDFRNMDIVHIGLESEIWINTQNYDDLYNIIFQIGYVQKESLDNLSLLSDGFIITAKYCERIGICFTVENKTTVLVKQIVSLYSDKTYFRGVLSLEFKSENLHIYYQTTKPICIPVARISVQSLEKYSFIAGLGNVSWGRSVMTFHEGMMVSNQVHKEIHVSSDGQALANYDIDTEYRGTYANFPIHNTTEFGKSILEYHSKVYFKPYSKYMYVGRKEKNLFEVGLAPKHLILKNMTLRNSKDTVFIQVTFEYRNDLTSKYHIYTWIDGKIGSHHEKLVAIKHLKDGYIELIFQFNINLQSKYILLFIKEKGKFNHLNEFKYEEFKTMLHPSVGKETSLIPIKVSYTIWRT